MNQKARTHTPVPREPVTRRSWGVGRVVALTLGLLILLPGLGLLTGGGVLLWAHWFSRSDGVVVSPEEQFESDGYALVSDQIDLHALPGWLPLPSTLGSARVDVTGIGADEVFVGIESPYDATAYLDGVRRTAVDGLGFDAPASSDDQLPGRAPTEPPTDQDLWIAAATGPGTQQVRWDPADRDWMFVVMNADGSAGVHVRARIGAELPALGVIGWSLLIGGLVVTFMAGVLLTVAVRRPSDRRPSPPVGFLPAPRGPTVDASWNPQVTGVDQAVGPADLWAVRPPEPSGPSQR